MYLVVSVLVNNVLSMKLERTIMLNAIKAVSISNLRDDWMVRVRQFPHVMFGWKCPRLFSDGVSDILSTC